MNVAGGQSHHGSPCWALHKTDLRATFPNDESDGGVDGAVGLSLLQRLQIAVEAAEQQKNGARLRKNDKKKCKF